MSGDDIGPILGARLQRIDAPRPGCFVLTLYRSGQKRCLVVRLAPSLAWGLVDERPRGQPATAFVQQLRKHLENATLVAVRVTGRGASLELRRGDAHTEVRLEAAPPNLVLMVADRVAGAWRRADLAAGGGAIGEPWPRDEEPGRALPTEGLVEIGLRLVADVDAGVVAERARGLSRALERRRAKLRRRLVAIETDLDRAQGVEPLRQRASLISSQLHAIPADAEEVELVDWYADPPGPVRVRIDPRRGPKGEAEALFRQARKLERGARVGLERHAETTAEIEALEALSRSVELADEVALDALEQQAFRLGARSQPRPRATEPARRAPHRVFRGTADRQILVGRSAADNDALTLHVARPHDLWLHARGLPGSHVVVRLRRGEACPPELLVDAAHLAAHFSDARGEAVVDVQHAPRGDVRKPRGAPPGAVTLSREKTIVLRVEPARLARLLASEQLA